VPGGVRGSEEPALPCPAHRMSDLRSAPGLLDPRREGAGRRRRRAGAGGRRPWRGARSWRSRGWGASSSWWTRATRVRWHACAQASAGRRSRSRSWRGASPTLGGSWRRRGRPRRPWWGRKRPSCSSVGARDRGSRRTWRPGTRAWG
jgi:hypothetical protein